MGETHRFDSHAEVTGPDAPSVTTDPAAQPGVPVQTDEGQPAQPVQPAPAEQPLILGRYRTNEDVQAALVAAQRKIVEQGAQIGQLGKAPAETPEGEGEPTEGAPAPQGEAEAATGLDLQPYFDEFSQTGALSDQSFDELAQRGLTRETVEGYIAGQAASAESRDSRLIAGVGGEEAFKAMFDWAAAGSWDHDRTVSFNDALQSGDENRMTLALGLLQQDYQAAVGVTPAQPLQGFNPVHSGVAPFRSQREQINAQKDSRYKDDPAYRAEVMARIEQAQY